MALDQDVMAAGQRLVLEDMRLIGGEQRVFQITRSPLYDLSKRVCGLLRLEREVTGEEMAQALLEQDGIPWSIITRIIKHASGITFQLWLRWGSP